MQKGHGFAAVAFLTVVLYSCRSTPAPEQYRACYADYLQGYYAKAQDCALQAAGRYKSDAETGARFELLAAESQLAANRLDDAAARLGKISTRQWNDRLQAAWSELHLKRGNLEQADALLAKLNSADPELASRVGILRSYSKILAGKRGEAAPILEKTAETARLRRDPYGLSMALLNLSMLAEFDGRFEEERRYASEAAGVAEAIQAFRVLAGALNNLATALVRLGDFDGALQRYGKSIELYRSIGDSAGLLNPLGNRGLVYTLQRDPANSAAAYREAFELAKELKNERVMAIWSANLANSALEAGNWNEAERWNNIAEQIAVSRKDQRRLLYVSINKGAVAAGRGEYEEAARLFQEALRNIGAAPHARWEVHESLAGVYAARKQYARANEEFENALRNIDEARSNLDPHYQMTFISRLMRFYQSYVEALVDQGSDEKAFQVASASRARVLAERLGADRKVNETISLSRLRAMAAARNTTLLSYWLAPDRSFVWLVNGSGLRRFEVPRLAEIEPLVAEYRRIIEADPLARADFNAGALWKALLEPVAREIPKGGRVVVVPDGPLHRLNLETLRTPEGRYWLEDVQVSVAPSLSILSEPAGKRDRGPALLIGDPAQAAPEFPPLSRAGAELRSIESSFAGRAVVRRGRDATPAAYFAAQPEQFSVIHFAAHADANTERPLESSVILSLQGNLFKLLAREVIERPIKADLVTISSCRSAGVRAYGGEGLIGFAWAFLGAGARSVIAGLWDVNDQRTEQLMSELYRGLAAGADPVTALHNAKMRSKEQPNSKPYYWAPFQVYVRQVF